jgi:hypothetical protein
MVTEKSNCNKTKTMVEKNSAVGQMPVNQKPPGINVTKTELYNNVTPEKSPGYNYSIRINNIGSFNNQTSCEEVGPRKIELAAHGRRRSSDEVRDKFPSLDVIDEEEKALSPSEFSLSFGDHKSSKIKQSEPPVSSFNNLDSEVTPKKAQL